MTESYEEHIQQLLWTKWSHGVARSESMTLVASLQIARSRFIAYLSGLNDTQLSTRGEQPAAQDASGGVSPLDVVSLVQQKEEKVLALINETLQRVK